MIIFTSGDLTQEQRDRLSQFSYDMLHKGVLREEELLKSIEKALQRFTPQDAEKQPAATAEK